MIRITEFEEIRIMRDEFNQKCRDFGLITCKNTEYVDVLLDDESNNSLLSI